jgi:hypothetical protein
MDLYASSLKPRSAQTPSNSPFREYRTETQFEYVSAASIASLIRRLGGLPSRYRLHDGDSTFLKLPGEIRNQIYSEVARDTPLIRLFEGRVVLPALGAVCQQVRKEMSGDYETDVVLDPSKPIYALVTNFNFDSLSRWLDKNSRDLKDKLTEPRLLHITSVLLSPDYAVDTLSPHKPEDERNQQSALDAHKNSLRTLEHSLETWAHTWTACDGLGCLDVLNSKVRGLGPQAIRSGRPDRQIRGYIVADRSGTAYAVAWNFLTIHRQHQIPGEHPTDEQKTGISYRGDFCHHFLYRNMNEIMKRADGGGSLDSPSTFRFVSWLECTMSTYHHISAHYRDDAFQQMTVFKKSKNSTKKVSKSSPQIIYKEQQVVAFYQKLDRINISRGSFDHEIAQHPNYLLWRSKMLQKGTKRNLAQLVEEVKPIEIATTEEGRRQKTRVLETYADGQRVIGDMARMIQKMKWLDLNDSDLDE